jgi:hypothetical protein
MSFLNVTPKQFHIQIAEDMPELIDYKYFDREAYLFTCPTCGMVYHLPRVLETTLFGLHLLRLSPNIRFQETIEQILVAQWDKDVYGYGYGYGTSGMLASDELSFVEIARLFDYPMVGRSDIYKFKLKMFRDYGGVHPFIFFNWYDQRASSLQMYSDIPIPQYLEHFKSFAFHCQCSELWDIHRGRLVSYREP